MLIKLKDKLSKILEAQDFVVGFNEIKNIKKFGHVYTNVAMKLKMDANTVADKLRNNFLKVEVAGNGFINIWLEDSFLRENIKLENTINTKYTNKKVLVEHSSPNLFKPFHIGHLMNNIIGEFVVRAIKHGGADVTVMSYPSDISIGIAKAIFIIKNKGGILNYLLPKTGNANQEIISLLGSAYVEGVKYFEDNKEDVEKIKEIKEIARKLYSGEPSEELEIFEYAKEVNIKYFISIMSLLGSDIEELIYESEAGLIGKKIVLENTSDENTKKVFTKSEGAVVYIPTEDRKDIHTSVFINSEGNPTYEGKDVGLLFLKFKKRDNGFEPEYSYFVTDSEQSSHFKSVFTAASEIDNGWKEKVEKSHHITHGRMTFKGEKMSSRLGGVPLALDTINAVIDEVKEKSGDRLDSLLEEEKEKVYFDISLSALRIAILRAKPGSNINFDPETSLSFEGDSGPYLQYTHARCFSLLEKGLANNFSPKLNNNIKISNLEIKLAQYSDVLIICAQELAPQKLVTYLFELAQEFNSYYAANQIIIENDENTEHRLHIVKSVKDVIKSALYILGINSVDKM